jgi:hypothetical protein
MRTTFDSERGNGLDMSGASELELECNTDSPTWRHVLYKEMNMMPLIGSYHRDPNKTYGDREPCHEVIQVLSTFDSERGNGRDMSGASE